MAGPIGKFMSGPYLATWGGASLGYTEKPWTYRQNVFGDLVRADFFGLTVVDMVTQGGEMFLMTEFLEFTQTLIDVMGIFAAGGAAWGTIGQAGLLVSGLGKTLILTAAAGTPAATAVAPAVGPATMTFPSARIAENNNLQFDMGSTHRHVPILFRIIPFIDSDTKTKFFSFT